MPKNQERGSRWRHLAPPLLVLETATLSPDGVGGKGSALWLDLLDIRIPLDVDAPRHALVSRTPSRVDRQCPVGGLAFVRRHRQVIFHPDIGDDHHTIQVADVALDIGIELTRLVRDPARCQRASQCAGQSAPDGGNEVVQRGRDVLFRL